MRMRVEGLRDLDRVLGELPKATARNVLVRVGKARLEPMLEDAQSRAPVFNRDLEEHLAISTKSGRYARWQGGRRQTFAEVFMGVAHAAGGGNLPQAHLQEFGSSRHAAQPFMRPAWDGGKMELLDGIADDLREEIDRASARIARKAARRAGG